MCLNVEDVSASEAEILTASELYRDVTTNTERPNGKPKQTQSRPLVRKEPYWE